MVGSLNTDSKPQVFYLKESQICLEPGGRCGCLLLTFDSDLVEVVVCRWEKNHMRYLGCLACAALLALAAYSMPSLAHHSFAAQFDINKPITLTGKVTKVEWFNPHVYFYIDVTDAKTKETANWAAEMNSPNSLMRLGWSRDTLKNDDVVTVQGSLAKDGSKLLNARSVVLASTNRRLFSGNNEETTP
jgi:hypothetical protein